MPHWRVQLGRYRRQLIMSALGVLPRRSMQFVPGNSRQFGPPRRWATWDAYRRRYGAEWHEVFPAAACPYPSASVHSELAARLFRDGWPAQGLATLRPGRVLDADGWPVGQNDTLLIDLATGLDRAEYTAFLPRRCRLDRSKSGRTLNLATCYGRENYCHFLLDALPRLELFLRSGRTWTDLDWILVPAFSGTAREPFYEALGLPSEKLIRLEPDVQYEFEVLYQPSFPGIESFVPPWVADFYRHHILEKRGIRQSRKRRLYVARSLRGIANEDEVWSALEARGFERVEPKSWEENVRLFAEADIIVGPHGAGLSNVIFSPKGAHLIELMPGDRAFPYFYSAACAAGLTYEAILLSPLTPPGREYRRLPSDEPQPVDLRSLLAAIDRRT